MIRTVKDYWLREPGPVSRTFVWPASAKTYRGCTATITKKGEVIPCGEPALVLWSERDGGKGRCKKHGGMS